MEGEGVQERTVQGLFPKVIHIILGINFHIIRVNDLESEIDFLFI